MASTSAPPVTEPSPPWPPICPPQSWPISSACTSTQSNHARCTPPTWAFNYYAGTWAEARAQWTQPTIDEDTFDDEGRCFADHVATAFVGSPQDSYKYQREVDGDLSAVVNAQFDAMTGQHFVAPHIAPLVGTWDAELEDRWPVIRTMAGMLLDGLYRRGRDHRCCGRAVALAGVKTGVAMP